MRGAKGVGKVVCTELRTEYVLRSVEHGVRCASIPQTSNICCGFGFGLWLWLWDDDMYDYASGKIGLLWLVA